MKQKINLRLFFIALIAVVASTIAITFVYYELFQQQVRQDLKLHAELLSDTELFQDMYAGAGYDNSLKTVADGQNESENAAEGETAHISAQTKAGSRSSDIWGNNRSETLERLRNENLRITWIDSDGSVLYDNDADAAALENHADRPEVNAALAYGEGESIRRSETFKLATFYYAMQMEDGTVLRVAMRVRTLTSIFLVAAPIILVLIAMVLGICVIIGQMLTASILQPIEMMAENIDDHNTEVVYAELKPFADKIRSQHEHILAAAESRQDFTANVSHELKTPLTAISGYAELIENHMIDPEQESYIASQIRRNSDRLLSMINDIIRLSELDHTELPRQFANMDLYAAAAECCRNLKINADQRHVSLSCTGNSAHISADPALIKELIENIVQNGIRYNREHGHVWVSVTEKEGHAILTVRDDGIGIPKDKLTRVFERFYRVDKGRSRDMGGTGLGLAIVKHIAEIHSAELNLDSILGEGTTITVKF